MCVCAAGLGLGAAGLRKEGRKDVVVHCQALESREGNDDVKGEGILRPEGRGKRVMPAGTERGGEGRPQQRKSCQVLANERARARRERA